MEYTKESLKEWAKLNLRQYALKSLGRLLELYASAWAQEVAELNRDKEELRELCRLKSDLENQSGSMAYECVPFGRRTELDNRISELWAKHMKGGEG